jgi:hypothetical protein
LPWTFVGYVKENVTVPDGPADCTVSLSGLANQLVLVSLPCPAGGNGLQSGAH